MTECDNAEMRDLLPDLVNDLLPAAERDRVQAHVVSCSACADEVLLLRAMRAARPAAPAVDVMRIVNALPRASRTPVLTLSRADASGTAAPRVDASREGTTRVVPRRSAFSGVWRIAATVGVAAIGGWSVLSYQRAQGPLDVTRQGTPSVATGASPRGDSMTSDGLQLPDTMGARVAMADTPRASAPASAAASRASAQGQTALSLGDLSDYSDDDLQRMLDRLDKWDGTTSADPVPTVPIVPVTERGIR